MEELVQIIDFPMYKVAPSGAIVNMKRGTHVSPSLNKQGHPRVNLYDFNEGKQYTRSVAPIVARAFVAGSNDIFNTPMHLNGDLQDCSAENLVWRPRWYAYNYHRQFTYDYLHTFGRFGDVGPLIEKTSNTMYVTALDACLSHGILILDLIRSLDLRERVRMLPFQFERVYSAPTRGE